MIAPEFASHAKLVSLVLVAALVQLDTKIRIVEPALWASMLAGFIVIHVPLQFSIARPVLFQHLAPLVKLDMLHQTVIPAMWAITLHLPALLPALYAQASTSTA